MVRWSQGARTAGDQSVKQDDDFVESEILLSRELLESNSLLKLSKK